LWFLLDTGRDNWAAIRTADLSPAWRPLLVASVITVATYLYLVRVWVRSLRWWHQRIDYVPALHVWFVSNLARFIPGMVWQFAGMAAMVQRHGVSPVAATAAVLLQQVTVLVTGVALTALAAPALLGRWTDALPAAAPAALAVLGLVVVIVAVRRVGPGLARLLRVNVTWPSPPRRALAGFVVSLGFPWLAYGVAFWLFGRAVLGAAAPDVVLASTAYVGSYVAGLIAVFAPAGLVVREAALVAALTPAVGGGPALALAVGSRLWLVGLELLTAVGVIVVYHAAGPGRPVPARPGGSVPTRDDRPD
jgi:hypothetical protein